ncbi:bifunctional tetrahydrofolate synthase/dihydrofolate synthase [Thiohalocapsa marina]|uniref:Dihydrofolate synthase/folylpolyglutamate synthase n=1 Tax=Thiohalocapsa marina TaxID=424902 RepID=A0A5M8FT82_9GAMM|nr:bifunctional tetrahydrofolate synthase/dihydrofolate synthase [Thiohalocapsa marina]KAA6187013.1 bifunctional tetrahydrofolate synthase/dihydrofolate synthase [Thiohalocapsa marina]
MRHKTLPDWLAWQETLHPDRIDLRLERVGQVWSRLGPARFPCPVITVGGTNGKGSCVAYLDAIYRAAGYRCGCYTSPHLLRYNERIRIDGAEVSDEAICEAFARIDAARGDSLLTYFEFGTLAALDLFVRAELDVVVLEVGLGGRLDAVNIIDADVAVVTSIGSDHLEWLGTRPEQIAFEKAGIFRDGRPAVIGQRDAPSRLRTRALEIGARPLQLGREYDYRLGAGQAVGDWDWQGPAGAARGALPAPALRGRFQYDNAAAALCAIDCLQAQRPVPNAAVRQGLLRVQLRGRFTVLPGPVTWILDVAHNAEAAQALAANLAAYPRSGKLMAVFSLLADKDAAAVVQALADQVAHWHLTLAPNIRAMSLEQLQGAADARAPGARSVCHADVERALAAAAAAAEPGDCVLVFGSFTMVEAALRSPWIAPV